MPFKRYLWFLGLSMLIVAGVWGAMESYDIGALSREWSSDIGGRALTVDALVLCVFCWCVSIWARSRRYQCLGNIAGVNISTRDAFESFALGRLFTLITPTAMLGGQPVSYFRLATAYPPRVAAGIVTVTTCLDIAFFVVTTPIVLWRVVFVLQLEHRYATLAVLTFAVYGMILLAFWLALSQWAVPAVRMAALFWSTVIPVWQKDALRRTFTHAANQLQAYVTALDAGERYAWHALVLTAVAVACPYIGIWWLLRGMGCNSGFLESMGNQLAINFMALVFSPGAGSGTSEPMFMQVFDQWEGRAALIHLAIFMTASYWSYILLGLIVWLLWRPRGSLLTLEISPEMSELGHDRLLVKVVDENGDGRSWEGSAVPGGDYSLFLPDDGRYRWSLYTAEGLLVEGKVKDRRLIKRVFIGPPSTC
jgi:hypothetical protein